MATFEQAQIPVENKDVYGLLRGIFERLFSADEVEKFLKAVRRKGLLIRDYEGILTSGAMEKASRELSKARMTARQLYEALPMADRAQVREFFLVRLEQVDEPMRRRFYEVYRLN